MRFLLDENLSPQLKRLFTEQGHDVICAYDAGLGGKSDGEVRTLAIAENRVLVTLDADFADLTRYPVDGTPGVVWLKPLSPLTFANIEKQLKAALAHLQTTTMQNRLVIIDRKRIRSRFGPLR